MNKEEINNIYKIYLGGLKNLSVPHRKLVICFSGFSGSGKTYVAKILEERYKGVRIRNDELREIIFKLHPKIKDKEKDKIVYGYLSWLFKNYKRKNNLFILDSGIDRAYKQKFLLFKKYGYDIFILRLKVSKKVAYRRAFERNKGVDEHFLSQIGRWISEWKYFGKNIESDIIIRNNKDNKLDLTILFKKLDKLIPAS